MCQIITDSRKLPPLAGLALGLALFFIPGLVGLARLAGWLIATALTARAAANAHLASSVVSVALSLSAGMFMLRTAGRPKSLIQFHACEWDPRSVVVRQALAALNLRSLVLPRAVPLAGKCPRLDDPNTGVNLIDPHSIVPYLFQTYGADEGKLPFPFTNTSLRLTLAWVACRLRSAVRTGLGQTSSRLPQSPYAKRHLMLYSHESSHSGRLVREELCALQVPYVLIPLPFGSPDRARAIVLFRCSISDFPVLFDPNRESHYIGASAILRHLRALVRDREDAKRALH